MRQTPVSADVVEPWLEIMFRPASDEDIYQTETARARQASAIYRPENLAPRDVDYSRQILDSV